MRIEQRRADRDRKPADQHHPAGQRVLRQRRLPPPQQHGAERPRDRGGKDEQRADRRARDMADVVAEQHRHARACRARGRRSCAATAARAAAPSRTARSRPASCTRGSRDRPAGICCTPNRISPFHTAMLNSASASTLPQSARGIRIESPDSRDDQQQAERRERQRCRAKRQRRELGDAELQHRPVAAPDQRQHRDQQQARRRNAPAPAAASRRHRAMRVRSGDHGRRAPTADRRRLAVFAPGAARAPASPTGRAGCARETRAARASNSSMSRSLQSAICRKVMMPRLCSMRSSTGPMPTIDFRSSGPGGARQDRRRRVVLDVDDQLPIARVVAARIGQRAEQSRSFVAKSDRLVAKRIGVGQRLPQSGCLAFAAAYQPCLFSADALARRGRKHRGRQALSRRPAQSSYRCARRAAAADAGAVRTRNRSARRRRRGR